MVLLAAIEEKTRVRAIHLLADWKYWAMVDEEAYESIEIDRVFHLLATSTSIVRSKECRHRKREEKRKVGGFESLDAYRTCGT